MISTCINVGFSVRRDSDVGELWARERLALSGIHRGRQIIRGQHEAYGNQNILILIIIFHT